MRKWGREIMLTCPIIIQLRGIEADRNSAVSSPKPLFFCYPLSPPPPLQLWVDVTSGPWASSLRSQGASWGKCGRWGFEAGKGNRTAVELDVRHTPFLLPSRHHHCRAGKTACFGGGELGVGSAGKCKVIRSTGAHEQTS